jgi:hypothetical protein
MQVENFAGGLVPILIFECVPGALAGALDRVEMTPGGLRLRRE